MTVFINKGDAPMSYRQAVKRGLRHFESEKAYWEREQGLVESDPRYTAWANQWVIDNGTNSTNNQFNAALYRYRKAVKRLEQHRVADGQSEVWEDQPTGEYDPETGEETTEKVLVQPAIDPVPPTVTRPVYDEDGNQTGTEEVINPLIVADDAERAEAQAVIDATPEDVKDFI